MDHNMVARKIYAKYMTDPIPTGALLGLVYDIEQALAREREAAIEEAAKAVERYTFDQLWGSADDSELKIMAQIFKLCESLSESSHGYVLRRLANDRGSIQHIAAVIRALKAVGVNQAAG